MKIRIPAVIIFCISMFMAFALYVQECRGDEPINAMQENKNWETILNNNGVDGDVATQQSTTYCDAWDTLGIGVDLSCFVFKKVDDTLYWAPKSSKRTATINKVKYYGVPFEESDYVDAGVVESEWVEVVVVYDWSDVIPGPLMKELLR